MKTFSMRWTWAVIVATLVAGFPPTGSQAAGPIHPGWHSVSGFQFQLDATPVTAGTVTLTEYIDEANMWAN